MDFQEIADYCLKYLSDRGVASQITLISTDSTVLHCEYDNITQLLTSQITNIKLDLYHNGRIRSVVQTSPTKDFLTMEMDKAISLLDEGEQDFNRQISQLNENDHFKFGSDQVDIPKMVERQKEFIRDLKAFNRDLCLSVSDFEFEKTYRFIQNSNGVKLIEECGLYDFAFVVILKTDNYTSTYNYGLHHLQNLNDPLISIGSSKIVLEQISNSINQQPLTNSFVGDVILSPITFNSQLENWLDSISSNSIRKGNSLFQDKLYSQVASPIFSLNSLTRHPKLAIIHIVTNDGYKAYDMPIIKDGVLQNFFIDDYTARVTGRERSLNDYGLMEVNGGNESIEEIIKGVNRGILVNRLSNSYPSLQGDYSVVVFNGYYIEDGKVLYPIDESMITLNVAEALLNISALSKERYALRNSYLPWVKISNVPISPVK